MVPIKRMIEAGVICGALAVAFLRPSIVREELVDVHAPRIYSDFRIVPVRVHLVRLAGSKAIGTALTKDDMTRIYRKANSIWHAAGIHLWVEKIVEEPPGHPHDPNLSRLNSTDELKSVRPIGARPENMFHVYYVGSMGVNGIFMARDSVFVQEGAKLLEVEGGIDEALPRVTAHELGHGMGLVHRQDRTNLMASGTTGTKLNDAEIEIVRSTVSKWKWAVSVDEFAKLAEEAKGPEARGRWEALADIPGESPVRLQAQKWLKAVTNRP